MQRIAKFEKVSFTQFLLAAINAKLPYDENELYSVYNGILLPKRATKGSAGYDFFLPFNIGLTTSTSITIPTGIKVRINDGWVLKVYPRSGFGFKYRLQLDNTVGIIDSDYYNNINNEGHIIIKMTNAGVEGKAISVLKDTAFAQGIFVEYGITEDDDVDTVREGGIGSTSPTAETSFYS